MDYRSTTGHSALFAGAQNSHTAVVDLLLRNGANPNLSVFTDASVLAVSFNVQL